MIAADIPLLGNLTIVENLALVRQYHQRLSYQRAALSVLNYLARANLAHLADMPPHALAPEPMFWVMFIRALMLPHTIPVIVRPTVLLPGLASYVIIRQAVELFEDTYQQCQLLELDWHQDKLRDLDGRPN